MAISQPHHPATQTDGDASGEANGTSLVAAPSPKVGARGRRSVRIRSAGRATSSAHRTRYGWINLSVPDAELDAFTDRFATRVASFDRLAIKTAKEILNTRSHVASGTDQQSTNARFLDAFARPEVKARIQRFMEKGGQQKDDLELNLGEHLPEL